MRKIINCVLGCVVLAVLIILSGVVGHIETHYTREGVVTEVNNNIVTVCDAQGNEWEFMGEGYSQGQEVCLTMYNANTDSNIYDDEVVKVRVLE